MNETDPTEAKKSPKRRLQCTKVSQTLMHNFCHALDRIEADTLIIKSDVIVNSEMFILLIGSVQWMMVDVVPLRLH